VLRFDWIARDRALLRDTAAAMIEANRAALPRQGQGHLDHRQGHREAGRSRRLRARCARRRIAVWSVNGGFDPARTQWSIDNTVENGDVPKDKKPAVEQVANLALAKEAVDAAGGPTTIGECSCRIAAATDGLSPPHGEERS